MTAPAWSSERLEVLRELYVDQGLSNGQCALRMKETVGAISGALHRFKIKRGTPRPPAQQWTPERLADLAQFAADGLSGAAIADRLGLGSTTVYRRAAQLGIVFAQKKPKAPPPAKAAAPPTSPQPPAPIRDVKPPMLLVSEPAGGGIVLEELCGGHCRWPLGDARREADGLQRFCGAAVDPDARPIRARYCRAHGAQAVASVQPMRRPNVYDPSVVVRRTQREAA